MSPTSYLCSTPQYVFMYLCNLRSNGKDSSYILFIQTQTEFFLKQQDDKAPRVAKNKIIRNVLIACGFFFTFLAILGAILPLLPTTPFLVAAAACFYRSSARFYNMIMNNPYFGHYLRDYKAGKGIPLRVKILSMGFLWASTLVSLIFFIPYLWLKILVSGITLAVSLHIYLIRTKHPE